MTPGRGTPGYCRYAPTAGPSRWLLVAGRRFVAAVESTVSDAVVDSLWWLATSELTTIESVVGAFPLSGADSVRSFAVAELGEPSASGEVVATAVVRGSAAMDVFSVGGARRFTAGGVQPWVLAEFRNVTGLVLAGDDVPTSSVARLNVGSLPIGLGVVDGELLTWTLEPIERVGRSAPAASLAAGGDASEETIIRDRNRTSSLFSHPGAGEGHPVAHELPGAVDIEEPGVVDIEAPEPPSPPTEPVALPPRPARFGMRIGSGDPVPLDRPTVIGRRPAPQRVEAAGEPRLVEVASPTQEVSGTHVRIEQSGDAVVVTDLRSTNGTTVALPGAAPSRLRPGESAVVLDGAVVAIGDGNIIEIIAVPAGAVDTDRPSRREDRREEGRE